MEQSLQVMSKQERLENWTARITACRSSGMTVRAWCQENGLSEKTYYYWQRRLFSDTVGTTAGDSAACLCGNYTGTKCSPVLRRSCHGSDFRS